MRGVAKMLEYKQKRNNGRTPFAGVYKFVCVCVGGGGGGGIWATGLTLAGHCWPNNCTYIIDVNKLHFIG